MSKVTWDYDNAGNATVEEDGLTATVPNYNSAIRASVGKTQGKWYWEVTVSNNYAIIGIIDDTLPIPSQPYNTEHFRGFYGRNGNKYNGASSSYTTALASSGETIGVAVDIDVGTIEFYRNGTSLGVAFTDIDTMGTIYPMLSSGYTVAVGVEANFGETPFQYNIPEGYKPYDYKNANWLKQHKILLLSEDNEVRSIDFDNGAIVKIPEQSEDNFINYGLNQPDLSEIDFSSEFTEKDYIQNQSTPLGEGKVFEQPLDVDKIIKSVKIT